MAVKPFFVRAEWDEEANVWVATSDDVPGLVTEEATMEGLIEKLKVIIPAEIEKMAAALKVMLTGAQLIKLGAYLFPGFPAGVPTECESERYAEIPIIRAARIIIEQGNFTALLTRWTDGTYSAQCHERPEAISQGETRAEALNNLMDAIKICLQHEKDEALNAD